MYIFKKLFKLTKNPWFMDYKWEIGQSYTRRQVVNSGAVNKGMYGDWLTYRLADETLCFNPKIRNGTFFGRPTRTIIINDLEPVMKDEMKLDHIL